MSTVKRRSNIGTLYSGHRAIDEPIGNGSLARMFDHVGVAVSDLAMPGQDGYTFVKRVRASEHEVVRALPLVAMTAYARAEDRHRILAAGFQRHVAKPIEPAELVAALAEMASAAIG